MSDTPGQDAPTPDPADESTAPDASAPAAPAKPTGGLAGSLSRAASGEALSASAIMDSIGGFRGILESMLPGVVFLATYILTQELMPSLIAPVVIGVIFFVARLIQRQPMIPALTGLIGIVICVFLPLQTSRALDYYVPGFFTNIAWGGALLISVLVRWPLIGVAIGYFTGQGTSWRKNKRTFQIMTVVTLLWVGVFASRLIVQLPLYFAENVEAIGIARLVMGIPLFAVAIGISWLIVRSTVAAANQPKDDDAEVS